jgi:isopenicillin-N N-acyltransferase like protein
MMLVSKKKIGKRLLIAAVVLLVLFVILPGTFYFSTKLDNPVNLQEGFQMPQRTKVGEQFYTYGNNWLKHSKTGLWEMYIEGPPFERGLANGLLSKELIELQEVAFIKQIRQIIPSQFYLNFLKYMTYWFDRKIDHYIPKEYLEEIYGVSLSASDQFDFIGRKYDRILNYHAAHDIGHAMQNYHLVGCTSFSVWGNKSVDNSLILGRNFDFYVGDEFALNKTVCFCKPDKGYKFMFITWGAMTGAVSGMNEKGIAVTINAAKSGIPHSAATPISIVVREILQYASNIQEAFEIAKKRKTFVSESIMVASAADHKTVIIEKTPGNAAIFQPTGDFIICTNHFQGEAFIKDPLNIANMKESASLYRYQRVKELLDQRVKIDIVSAAQLLRDQKGLHGQDIGMGNEKAINQLIAHHSVIFQPESLKVWVSTCPFQIGNYICYDLGNIFSMAGKIPGGEICNAISTISPDTTLLSPFLKNYKEFKRITRFIRSHTKANMKISLNDKEIEAYLSLNPQFYEGYEVVAEYFQKNTEIAPAIMYYQLALKKEIPDLNTRRNLERKLVECYKNKGN